MPKHFSLFVLIDGILLELLLVIVVAILAYSAWLIRKTIKEHGILFPNEKLVRIHLFNSIMYAALFLLTSSLKSWSMSILNKDDFDWISQDSVKVVKI